MLEIFYLSLTHLIYIQYKINGIETKCLSQNSYRAISPIY